ncbi:hypothetical protein [Providencia hangzhouensis]
MSWEGIVCLQKIGKCTEAPSNYLKTG